MKQRIFDQYVDHVCELFNISREKFFAMDRKTNRSEARHMVYYLCSKRPMSIANIQKCMKDNGCITVHSPICYGISIASKRIRKDQDYADIISEIKRLIR